ncbi:hypothetical protein [Polynucleobacter sp. AP-Nino-20-G2]|uniref:hypothetical protein n=1 Tax=Polynucleobacter sp. AP-Nino-20-G2 TaxID=2576917 RepID=UPI001BFEE53A|nr:hypothetical protein [Polynucleobacter sp. AP-Nino-20-G2]QWE17248.1 hypothetical protein FD960_03260 [Polynucleobacter sp. AP-Nino-20-G2]
MKMCQLPTSLSRFLLLTVTVLFLSACDRLQLPEYWLCSGTSQQLVLDSQGAELERYEGNEPLMLEIWGSHVYQFLQGSFSGGYSICSDDSVKNASSSSIQFGMRGCQANIDFYRMGIFNVESGELLMKDSRKLDQRVIRNQGRYQCRKKGRSFNFSEFNHV